MDYNVVGWFEIPVINMDRAKAFYEKVFNITISVHDLGELQMGWFPSAPDKKGASGSLVQHGMYKPSSTDGPLIYFTCPDLTMELRRVEEAQGEIMKPKTEIGGGHGFMALVKDTEGNRIALHSLK